MTRTASSPRGKHSAPPLRLINDAKGGDIEAMTLIQKHYDPYIRRLATINMRGTSYLNIDLYDRLKTRLIMTTLKFKL